MPISTAAKGTIRGLKGSARAGRYKDLILARASFAELPIASAKALK